jgi:hypothetical protein
MNIDTAMTNTNGYHYFRKVFTTENRTMVNGFVTVSLGISRHSYIQFNFDIYINGIPYNLTKYEEPINGPSSWYEPYFRLVLPIDNAAINWGGENVIAVTDYDNGLYFFFDGILEIRYQCESNFDGPDCSSYFGTTGTTGFATTGTPALTTEEEEKRSSSNDDSQTRVIVGAVVGVVLGVAAVAGIAAGVVYFRRKKERKEEENLEILQADQQLQEIFKKLPPINEADLVIGDQIGKGGFGEVYAAKWRYAASCVKVR